jgi:hypothetical protein
MPFSSNSNRSNERSQWLTQFFPLNSDEMLSALRDGFKQEPSMEKNGVYFGFPPGDTNWGVFDPVAFLQSLVNPNINYTSGEWTDMGVSSSSSSTSSSTVSSSGTGSSSGGGGSTAGSSTSGTSSMMSSVSSSMSSGMSSGGGSSIISSFTTVSSGMTSGTTSSVSTVSSSTSTSTSTSTIGLPDDDCQDCYAEVVYPDGTIDYIGGCGAEEGPWCFDEVNSVNVQVPWSWAACFEPEIALSKGAVTWDSTGAHCTQTSTCPLFILNDEGSTQWELCSCAICNGCSTCIDRGYPVSVGFCYVNFYCCYVRRFGVSETLPPCAVFAYSVLVYYPTSDEAYCPQLCDPSPASTGGP